MTVRKAGRLERFLARRINGLAYQLNKINQYLIMRNAKAALEEISKEKRRPKQ